MKQVVEKLQGWRDLNRLELHTNLNRLDVKGKKKVILNTSIVFLLFLLKNPPPTFAGFVLQLRYFVPIATFLLAHQSYANISVERLA